MAIGGVMNNQVSKSKGVQGFSMVEVLFAVGVLAVGIVGGMAMIVIGIGRNGANRLDTTATNVAQSVLEDIASVPANVIPNPLPSLTDCQNNNWPITTANGGAALAANGDIDFSAAPVGGYQMRYVACGPTGLAAATYDVRWHVQQVQVSGNTWAKLVTVSAQQPLALVNGSITSVPPVTLRTVVGM
jgi:Tfp pilus assembly protein PilV